MARWIIGVVSGHEIHCHWTFATVARSMIFRATVVVATGHGFFWVVGWSELHSPLCCIVLYYCRESRGEAGRSYNIKVACDFSREKIWHLGSHLLRDSLVAVQVAKIMSTRVIFTAHRAARCGIFSFVQKNICRFPCLPLRCDPHEARIYGVWNKKPLFNCV